VTFTIRNPGLRFPRTRTRRSRTTAIIVHHLDAHWDVHRVHQAHLNRGWNGIGYNYHIAMDGTISLGRGLEFQGAHTDPPAGTNGHTLGIGCEGRYHSVDRVMPDGQYNALVWLIRHLRGIYGDLPIRGHRDLAATACPGQFFPLAEVQRLQFRQPLQQQTPPQNIEPEETEMTQAQFNQMMDTYLAEQRQRPVSTWAEDYWRQAVQRSLLDGTAPQGNLTRQEASAVFSRVMGLGLDVSEWAKDAWEYATEAGIVDGTNPREPVTREQVIVILDRLGLIG